MSLRNGNLFIYTSDHSFAGQQARIFIKIKQDKVFDAEGLRVSVIYESDKAIDLSVY